MNTQNQEHELTQSEADFKWLMSLERGRRIVCDLLVEAGVFRASIGRGLIKDPAIDMAYAEGQKSVGFRLMKQIEDLCPERYAQMMKEQNDGRSKLARTARQQSPRRQSEP